MEAVDGGILLAGRDGRYWNVTPEQLSTREKTGERFEPFTHDECVAQLKREFGDSFEIVTTKHYVICSNAGKTYARWCGQTFERLFSSFMRYWDRKPLQLRAPEWPLVAIVFADKKQFSKFAEANYGMPATDADGFYSVSDNRMVLYDLTASKNRGPIESKADLHRRLEAMPFNVATVVHEATHQIAFNCGLHTRYADNPLWLTEGMAMYFETPDLRSRNGWRTAGKINRPRLNWFLNYAAKRRQPDALATLISSDRRFVSADKQTSAQQQGDAYAESWAFSYFLIKKRRRLYFAYLHRVSQKQRLIFDSPDQRLREFKSVFGDDMQSLDKAFLRAMKRLAAK